MPRLYSTVSGHLTLTLPKPEDMRMNSTQDITPEASLSEIPTTVGGIEEMRRNCEHIKLLKRHYKMGAQPLMQ